MKRRAERTSGPFGRTASVGDPADAEAESIGDYLATQRRLRGISLEELGLRTRIPLRSLERLEGGAFDGQLDGFVRGFVRTVALDLGLDPDETLMRMQAEPVAAFRARRTLGHGPRRAVFLLALLVLIALVGAVVRVAVQPLFEPRLPRDVVVRHDPVRALAEAELDSLPNVAETVAAPAPADGIATLIDEPVARRARRSDR